MKKFLSDNHVLVIEEKRLKEKLLDESRPFHFTPSQYYNRHKGLTQCTCAERVCMAVALAEVRKELATMLNPRPLDELDDAK